MLPPNWPTMDFADFAQQRTRLLSASSRPADLVDGANTNLYGTLAHHDTSRFPQIAASTDPRAAHRCHLAEAFLSHLGLSQSGYKSRTLISQGVRYSLSLIFKQLAHEHAAQLILPSDVYPVYAVLAKEAGLAHETYAARAHLPWTRLESHFGWCLLVCDPLKPWGGGLDNDQWDRLAEVATATGSLVLIDRAYDLSLPAGLRSHLEQQSPFAILGSLSKGWLSPLRGGLVLASERQAQSWRPAFQQAACDTQAIRRAYAALRDHPDRPGQVGAAIAKSRHQMLSQLAARQIPVSDPGAGYFLTTPLSPPDLLACGVLGLPPSVFGAQEEPGCVISTLGVLD